MEARLPVFPRPAGEPSAHRATLDEAQEQGAGVREISRATGSLEIVAVPASKLV